MADADFSVPVPTLDALVDFVRSTVTGHFSETGLPTNGAVLAERVRERFGSFSYAQLGLQKLSDVVTAAERQGVVRRDRTVKHLQVFPVTDTAVQTSKSLDSLNRPLHIRDNIWRAFVHVGTPRDEFYDRENDRVVNEHASDDCKGTAELIKIKPIPLNTQQQWMQEFLGSKGLKENDAPIDDPYCFTRFPEWLKSHGNSLDRDWKRFRVRRVEDWVREWANDHEISADQFFEVARPRTLPSLDANAISVEMMIRNAILAAVADLPLDELQHISIPVKYLLQARDRR